MTGHRIARTALAAGLCCAALGCRDKSVLARVGSTDLRQADLDVWVAGRPQARGSQAALAELTERALLAEGARRTGLLEADARLTGIHSSDGMAQTFTYDPLDRVTYRSRGSQMAWRTAWTSGAGTTTDSDGNTVTVSLDGRGRPAKKTYQAGSSSVSGLAGVTYSYTDLDQVAQADRTGADGAFTTHYSFDSRARTTAISSDGTSVNYGYGDHSSPTLVTTPGGAIAYDYDEFGRILKSGATQVRWEPGGQRLTSLSGNSVDEARCYTPEGFLATVAAGPGASCAPGPALSRFDYTYDKRGNRKTETYPPAGGQAELTQYGYDGSDRVNSVQYGANRSVGYTMIVAGARTSETLVEVIPPSDPDGETVTINRTTHYTLDDAERLTGISDDLGSAATSDGAGRIKRLKTNGLDRSFSWDAAGRLVSAP